MKTLGQIAFEAWWHGPRKQFKTPTWKLTLYKEGWERAGAAVEAAALRRMQLEFKKLSPHWKVKPGRKKKA